MTGTSRSRTAVSFILVTLIWGSTWLVIKDQIAQVPPSWTVTWRFLVAALGMIALATVRRESLRISRPAMGMAALVGFFQFSANFQFVYRSERYLTSGLVAIIFALLMVPNAVLARIFLGQRMTARFVVGSLVAIGGIALLLLNEVRLAPPQGAVGLGIVMALVGLFSASIANVAQASATVRDTPGVPFLAWALTIGAVGDAVFAWIVSGPPVIDPRPQYLAGIAYLGIVGSVVTFPLYLGLIRDLGPGKAAYNGVAVPVVAMALSTLFEGFRWTGLAVVGSLLALAGLLVALSGRK